MKQLFKNLLKSKWTKWEPLGSYNFGDKDYIVFFKKNTKNGLMSFKTKIATPWIWSHSILPVEMINTQKAWDKMIEK